MKTLPLLTFGLAAALGAVQAGAVTGVVEQWSDASQSAKIIDINFSDTSWPWTWAGETGRDCPSMDDGGYVNAVLDAATSTDGVKYPVLFHNCTFTRPCQTDQ